MVQFDPYRKWLGIPPKEQPPNFYRLLGIGTFESDPDVISNAADRQMVHVRTFQSGKYSELSQRILNELSSARVCLLDARKKSEYDGKLRAELAADTPGPPPPRASPPPPRAGDSGPAVPQVAAGPSTFSSTTRSSRHTARRKKSAWQGGAITLVLVCVSLVLLIWVLNRSESETPEEPPPVTVKRNGHGEGSSNADSADERRGPRNGPPPKNHARPPENGSGNDPNPVDQVGEIRRFEGHTGGITGAVFMPDGESVLSGGGDKSLRLWEVKSGSELRRFEGSADPVLAVACSPDGQKVLAVSGRTNPPSGGFVNLWETAGGQQTDRIDVSKAEIAWDAKFSPDGKYIVLACEDRTIRLLDAVSKKKQEVQQFSGHEGPVRSVACSPDGSKILSGSADHTVRLWDCTAGTQIHCMRGHKGAVTSVAFSPDGNYALSGGVDKTIRLWDLKTGKQRQTCRGHLDVVTCVAYSPDGRFALSGSASFDRSMRLWSLADGAEVHRFDKHEGGIRSVAFSSDGRHALSAGDDAVVRLWGLPQYAAGPVLPDDVAGGPQGQTADAPGPKSQRIPLPDAELQQQAEKTIKDGELSGDFAATSRPARGALAGKLLEQGTAPREDTAVTYVLLRLARDEATGLGHADTALAAVGEIGRRYEIDVMSEKIKVLEAVSKVTTAPGRKLFLAGKIVAASDEALAAAELDAAERLVEMARPLAATKVRDGILSPRRASKAPLAELVEARAERIRQVKQGPQGTEPEPGEPGAVTDLKTLSVLGGNDASEAAVELALDWLARHQHDDGSWSFDHVGEECGDECPDPGTLTRAPNAATALALLPLLGAGHGPRQGKFQQNVTRGLYFLKNQMQIVPGPRPAGTLYEPAAGQMPSHALGTVVLCEAAAANSDMQTRAAAIAAVEFVVRTQNSDGGWPAKLPSPGQSPGQSTVYATGWNLAALKTAEWAGLKVKISANRFQRAAQYLENLRTEDGSGYRRGETATSRDATATAVAVLSQMYLGWPRDKQELVDQVAALSRSGPSVKGQFDLNYHNCQVMRHYGGPAWDKWNAAMRDHLIAEQQTEGHAAGSWFVESNQWTTAAGGRLFCTAAGALILEVYYRHPPLYQ